MTKSEKTLNKMKANPKDWRIEQLEIIAKNRSYVQKIMDKNHLDTLLMPITTQGSATYRGDLRSPPKESGLKLRNNWAISTI